MAVAVAVTAVQAGVDAPFGRVDYRLWPWLGLGFGLGAASGDAIKSLFKRRRGRPAGTPWIPFDQVDFKPLRLRNWKDFPVEPSSIQR